uniref:Ig-like domain-containing protein n=1 Tax=Sphaeramia orbicularis TaxID=375764 RepID=A0A673BH95_9TELE
IQDFLFYFLPYSNNGWRVTYTSTQICALKGSTVDMSCTYTYPYWIDSRLTKMKEKFWFINGDIKPVDLKTESEYKDRVLLYDYGGYYSSVRISDLRQSDSAQYQFRFITNQPGGRYTGSPGVTLTVTGKCSFSVFQSSGEIIEGSSVTLTCTSDANPPVTKYTWYKRGKNQLQSRGEGQQFVLSFINSSDSGSYSCIAKNMFSSSFSAKWKSVAAGVTVAILLPIILISRIP